MDDYLKELAKVRREDAKRARRDRDADVRDAALVEVITKLREMYDATVACGDQFDRGGDIYAQAKGINDAADAISGLRRQNDRSGASGDGKEE